VSEAQGNLSTIIRGLEPFPEYIGLKRSPEVELPLRWERRRYVRANVHWTVRLVRHPDKAPLEGVTDNISSRGFYCICDEPFVPGEYLECVILVPTQTRTSSQEYLVLRCLVQAMWVQPAAAGRLGVGFYIEDYRVMPPEFVREA